MKTNDIIRLKALIKERYEQLSTLIRDTRPSLDRLFVCME